MGDAQLGRLDDPIAEEQQVEVEGPLAPVDRPDPAEPRFDLLQDVEQRERVERRLERGRGVEKHPLARRAADGLGLVKRADLLDGHARRMAQGGDRPFERGPAVAEVAAQTDQARDGTWSTATDGIQSFSLPIRSTASISRGVSTVKAARM